MVVRHKAKVKLKTFLDNYSYVLENNKDSLPNKVYLKHKFESDTNSWFSLHEFPVDNVKQNNNGKVKTTKKYFKSLKITMNLTSKQKEILNSWFVANTDMYNETLSYLRQHYPLYKNFVVKNNLDKLNTNESNNYYFLRDKLKNVCNEIQQKSQLTNYKDNTKIHTHTLNYSVKQLVSNLKSAVSNLKNGNFKRFRLKFWKNNRPSQTLEIEKCYVNKNKICPKILGEIKYIYNKEEYILPEIKNNVKINYNSILNEYFLLIPQECVPEEPKNKRTNTISLDPGIRTFMTGLSEDNAIKIGTDVNETIVKKIVRLNKIKNNKKIPTKIKKKNELMINRKIEHMTDDLHWKSIKYLIDNYKSIFLGDMSAKSIVRKTSKILSPEKKVACLRTKFYVFKQRLEYKCVATKTMFTYVDEMYTSKTCSLCGNYDDKLKGKKMYNCKKCKKKLDRDINGCRNIYFKYK
jgi:transposase